MTTSDPCICAACQPDYRLMRACATCGYKRCPGAANHRNTCTGSNEPGQPGSLYADPPTDQENPMPAKDRHAELVALLTEIRDRLPEPEGVSAVEDAPTDDGLAEWERELLRPATCCGKCPPIAGGGYDCTCEGNPRCEKADTPEEWRAEPAPADDLPGEPVEPGDLRAGDRVAFRWMGERMTGTLVSDQGGDVLRSGTPDRDDYYPNVTLHGREWCAGIFDVRLIERAPREGELDAAVWHRQFEKEKARAEKAEAELDECRVENVVLRSERDDEATIRTQWKDRAKEVEAERDGWRTKFEQTDTLLSRTRDERDEVKRRFDEVYQQAVANAEAADGWRAKHAAFRRDVENIRNGWRRRGRGHVKALTDTAADQVQGALNRDAARTSQSDREAMLGALADAERRNGPLPTVDWETPEELSQKSIDSFIESRDPSDHPEQKPTDGKPSTVRQMPRRRTPQADPDTVTLRRDDSDLEVEINSEKGKPSSCIVRHRGVTIFHGVSLDAIVTDRPLRAALGWGDEA